MHKGRLSDLTGVALWTRNLAEWQVRVRDCVVEWQSTSVATLDCLICVSQYDCCHNNFNYSCLTTIYTFWTPTKQILHLITYFKFNSKTNFLLNNIIKIEALVVFSLCFFGRKFNKNKHGTSLSFKRVEIFR